MRSKLLHLVVIFSLISCKRNIQYHPNEVRPVQKSINQRNIDRINQLPVKDSFQFIFTGDTQLAYDELRAFITHVNQLENIAFVLLNGDLTEFGLNSEFNVLVEKLNKLRIPYIAAIGNHDMLANGRQIYNEMFGVENFTFSYSGSWFVVMNTNSREVEFDGSIPDLYWLQQTLTDSLKYKNIFFVSHIIPYSYDFDSALEVDFNTLVSTPSNARISLHGHDHQFSLTYPYKNGFPYLTASNMAKRKYVLVTVKGTTFTIEEKSF